MSSIELVLLIISILTLMFFSFFSLFKAKKKINSKKIGEKKEGIQKLKGIANENSAQSVLEIGVNIFKNLF
ncbi:hypothetical protein [Chryseobacterium taiwanense]|uniref:Uncharacterized protein n=1 Tax=Chryseobacterium taiwanense TaxID=363331 RepID=A0A0B4DGC1_9FLAO|nr:hypothetical protein [Chryseobacterium taiwanense]KIC63475.1 hypothetical protein RM51_07330 [Chryseobacterium taiwanense]